MVSEEEGSLLADSFGSSRRDFPMTLPHLPQQGVLEVAQPGGVAIAGEAVHDEEGRPAALVVAAVQDDLREGGHVVPAAGVPGHIKKHENKNETRAQVFEPGTVVASKVGHGSLTS